jgi:heavy metal sensor kinase
MKRRGISRLLSRTRVRLTAVSAGIFTVVIVASAMVFWLAFSSSVLSDLDRSMSAQAQRLAARIHDQPAVSLNNVQPDESAEGIGVEAILIDGSGLVLDRTSQAPSPAAALPWAMKALKTPAPILDTAGIDRDTERVLAERIQLGNGKSAALVLTRPTTELQQTLSVAGWYLAIAVVATVTVGTALTYWLAGRALRPVGVITGIARELSDRDLHRRIDLDLPPDELGKLADTLNEMLARLESAFESLRQFTSDAAHELRAPLALIRTEVEVTLASPRAGAEYEVALRTVLAETERLSRMADQLLLLARADAGALTPQHETVDFKDLLEETIDRWQHVASERKISLVAEIPSGGRLEGDADLLRRLLDNLIDNAVRHTPAAGRITVKASLADHTWHVTVVDSGPGVAPQIQDRLFERFSRGDSGRGRETGGAGLGLALCAAIAAAHGGGIRLERSVPPGARFIVQLPAAD